MFVGSRTSSLQIRSPGGFSISLAGHRYPQILSVTWILSVTCMRANVPECGL